MDPGGVTVLDGAKTVKETIDKIVSFLKKHGATIYARIDQQDELRKNGLSIPPLEFLLFGNPKAGGPIMMNNPIAGLDLPLKVISWEDAGGKVWLAFNDAAYIKERYQLPDDVAAPLDLAPIIAKALQ